MYMSTMKPMEVPKVVEVPLSELRTSMRQLIGQVEWHGDALVLTRHGTPVAAVIGIYAYTALHRLVTHAGLERPRG